MKIYLFLCIVLSFYQYGSSCTIIPNAFCTTIDRYPENLILSGVIVAIDSTGIDIAVLDILRGEELRDTIRVWDGTDFECNGIWSMAASDIGDLFDSIIIILPKITELENEWDVLGDYRRPDPYWETSELHVKDGNVNGFISGDAIAPPEYNLWSYNYEDFKSWIIKEGECISLILKDEYLETEPYVTVNNPFESFLIVNFSDPLIKGFLNLYSIEGSVILKREIKTESQIELEFGYLPSGLYLLEIYTQETRVVLKLIKNNSQ